MRKAADPPFYFSALKIALSDARAGEAFSRVVCFRRCFNRQRHIGLLVLFDLKLVVGAAMRTPGGAGAAAFFADSPSWCCRRVLLGFADPSYELRCGGFVW